MNTKIKTEGMPEAIPHEANGRRRKAAAWITRALRLLSWPRPESTNRTTIARPLISDPGKKAIEALRLRQTLERSSISADGAYLSKLHRRGLGKLATKACVADQKVNVRLRISEHEPQRHMGIKHALSRNPRNTLVEMDYQSPIGEFLRQLDLEDCHIHFGLAPGYLFEQLASESTHLLLVIDDDLCVDPHHVPISVMAEAVIL